MKTLLILLLLTLAAFAQTPIWGTSDAKADTVQIVNTGTKTGRVILFEDEGVDPDDMRGNATVFFAGDSLDGTTANISAQYRLYLGDSDKGDALYGPWVNLGTITTTYLKEDLVTGGQTVEGIIFPLPNATNWSIAGGIQFRATGSGTQETALLGRFWWN